MSFMQSAWGKVLLFVALAQGITDLLSCINTYSLAEEQSHMRRCCKGSHEQSVDVRMKVVNVTAEEVIGNVLYDGLA